MRRRELCGLGNTGLAIALVAPLCPWWAWPVLALGLWLTCSWLAILAALVGACWRWSWLTPWALLALVGFLGVLAYSRRSRGGLHRDWLAWTPRGDSLDSIVGRVAGLILASSRLTWRGRGAGSMARDLKRWTSRGVRYLPADHLHCDPMQVAYEYGLVGALAILGALALFVTVARPGEAWSAAALSFGVLSLGHSPSRVFYAWVRRLLPQPPLLAEITIHVARDGTFRQHTPLIVEESPEVQALVANAIIRAGFYFAEQRGLKLNRELEGVS